MRSTMTLLVLLLAGCGDAGFKGNAKADRIDKGNGNLRSEGADATAEDGNDGGDGGSEATAPAVPGGGDGGDKTTAGQPAAGDGTAKGEPEASVADVIAGLPDHDVLARCFQSMGVTKLPKEAAEHYKVLDSHSFAPFAKNAITDEPDDEDNPVPSIVMVHVDGFGPVVSFDFELLNPKGFYCVTGNSKSVFTDSKITICKTAKLGADIQADMGTLTANKRKIKC